MIHIPQSEETIKLIKACQLRDSKAQKQLYYLLVDRLYLLVSRYFKDDYYRKNVMQDIFLKIFNNIDKYNSDLGSFNTWANTIAKRHCLNHLKKIKPSISLDDVNEATYISEADITNSIQTEELYLLLSRIKECYKRVFILHEIEGYNHAEIASMLGLSESSSRTYLFRAREKLIKGLKNKIK